ncbi:MAG: hypothetical protein KBS80_02875 [Bacteroidales bacterium]|nr:hypothetical protein [Candidatus Cryptobacteroides choladohippi]
MNHLLRILLFCAPLLCACSESIEKAIITADGMTMQIDVCNGQRAVLARLGDWELVDSTLFRIDVRNENGETICLESTGRWNSVKMSKDRTGYLISFMGPESIPDASELNVCVRIKSPSGKSRKWYESSAIRMTWERGIFPDCLTLEQAALLPVSARALPEGSSFFVPLASGIVHPAEEAGDWDLYYPQGFGASMPWLAFWDKDGAGFYYASHEKNATFKTITLESEPGDHIRYEYSCPSQNEREFAPCEMVIAPFKGDWFDASQMYRDWVKAEAAWYPRDKMDGNGRTDTPQWMKEMCIWLSGSAYDTQVEEFQQAVGIPVGLHWTYSNFKAMEDATTKGYSRTLSGPDGYCWHQNPFDNDYPHYFPATNGFEERVKELQARNIRVMPYINGRLWDTRDNGISDSLFTKVAMPAVTKDRDGNPNTESYGTIEKDGSPVVFGVMCPTTELWQNKVKDIVLSIINDCGADGVYIDQIAAAQPRLCYDSSHGHPTGGGDWWKPAYRTMLANIRSEMRPGSVITTESNDDGCVDQLDGFMTWQFFHDRQVPAFAAVYCGAIQIFGRRYDAANTPSSNRMIIAQSLTFGEQLGWMNSDVATDPELMPYLMEAVSKRYRYREYFYRGEMIKSPRLIGDNPRQKGSWVTLWGPREVSSPSVLCGAWQITGESRRLYLFTNYSDQPVTLGIEPADGQKGLPSEYTFRPGEVLALEVTR